MIRVESSFKGKLSDDLIEELKEASIQGAPVYHQKDTRLEMTMKLPELVSLETYERFCHEMAIALHCAIDLSLELDKQPESIELASGYLSYFISKDPRLSGFWGLHGTMSHEGDIVFSTLVEDKYHVLKKQAPLLEDAIAKAGLKLPVVVKLEEESEQEAVAVAIEAGPKLPKSDSKKPKTSYKKLESSELPIAQAESGMEKVTLKGHIFHVDSRTMKNGSLMQLIYLSDYQDAIICKRFEGRRFSREEMEQVKPGMQVAITGKIEIDTYLKDRIMMISDIEAIPAVKRMDTASDKRVEWHVHSNFSEMDGVCAIEDFIQTAWDWGMEAIGVCDHQVVQAFPLAQHKIEALMKKDPDREFKMLYGCEMVMVDDTFRFVDHPDERALDDLEYVVFDLETTGLSNRLDTIIEFGAARIKDRDVVETKQMFINPERKLPAKISDLTNILQSDVDDAKTIEEAFDEIRDFLGDAVLVAHNATFDMGMLNAAARKLGKPEFTNPVIDTLPIAQATLDLKSFRLGMLCRHFNVQYDGEGAHRADYDAAVLASAFLKLLDLYPDGTLNTLANLDQSKALMRNHGYHINVFAKNKAGLKELFELVSLSHTKYLKYNPNSLNVTGVPIIPRSVLKAYHEKGNLLYGTSCQNSKVFDLAMTKSEADLKEELKFYDFAEIQPLDVYKNLIDRQSIENRESLKKILGFIIEAADDLDIPVIASGDCHYIHPHQKRVRDIYINAKATGASRHPLYRRSLDERRNQSAPNQHFLTTDQMLEAFDWLPERRAFEMVVTAPKKLAAQMEPLYPIKDKLYPPDIPGSDQKLRDICYQTARETYGEPLPKPVEERLERELNAIIGAGYYVVYYISHLLVKKSNEDGYLVGSRGSVGSSFVATMSGITEVNPLKPHYLCPKCKHLEWIEDPEIHSGFDLPDKNCPECGTPMKGDGQDIPFETFLGFEGDKVPDIDLNFSGEYQPNAHAFTKTIFGEDHVFRAGTVGTVKDKTAFGFIRGYEEEMDEELFNEPMKMELSMECAGVKRTTGQHPGGIVVVPLDMDVHDFTPYQFPANNPYAEWKTTHFDFHQIHDNILKFDILGHVDPTAMKLMERLSGIDVKTIPMNDRDTLSIFSSPKALNIDMSQYNQPTGAAGIPEFGTPFVRGILNLTRPTTFAELVSISGLSHGTDVWLNNAKDLIDAGICNLRQVIGCRDDIMVDLIRYGLPSKASFTIMESVRKGKGLKPEWESLMKEHAVPDWYMDSCRKIKYMFPKAHAVAYVIMAIRIAWFKVHKPIIYYCQYFSIRCDAYDISAMLAGKDIIQKRMSEIELARQDKTKKVEAKELAVYDTLELALEMYLRGYHFSPMSINRSHATEFRPDPDDPKGIIPPFTAVDSLGDNVAKSIVAAREERPFLSKEDVLNRTQLSKTLIERLDGLHALDGLDESNQMTLF